MSAVHYRFIEPLDVLFLRGNKLFGDPGSFGESLVPPWPSVAAGAIRSRMLADDRVDLAAFARGKVAHPTLGTPAQPGSFAVIAFHLARRHTDGRVEALTAPPADVVITRTEAGSVEVRKLTPTRLPGGGGLACSYPLPCVPVLAQAERGKPAGGYWITESGWHRYLAGGQPHSDDLVKSDRLWQIDPRVGVGLDAATRRAADGRLFSVQAVAMTQREHATSNGFDTGLLIAVAGAEPPRRGMVRLGGDGRAAALHEIRDYRLPEPNYAAIAAAKRCRLILMTPGLFPEGWLPIGTTRHGDDIRFDLHGVRGRLVCAAVPRAEVVSGWDLAKWQPKAAERAAPTGSVYWLDDVDATPDALHTLVERGLWSAPCEDAARRAEGFNRATITVWTSGRES
jgi:CRISPR-associated protein Cmr3